jgi:hypothetical protein
MLVGARAAVPRLQLGVHSYGHSISAAVQPEAAALRAARTWSPYQRLTVAMMAAADDPVDGEEEDAVSSRETELALSKKIAKMADGSGGYFVAFAYYTKIMQAEFAAVDSEGVGRISSSEFKTLMESVSEGVSESEADALFAGADADGDGRILYVEWTKMMTERAKEVGNEGKPAGGKSFFGLF